MRTTIDLPPDLHRLLLSLAAHGHKSLSRTAVELMQRGLGMPATLPTPTFEVSSVTGLPVVLMARTITPEDVAAFEDDA